MRLPSDVGALPEPLFLRRPDFGGICQEQVKLPNSTAVSDTEMLTNIHIYDRSSPGAI